MSKAIPESIEDKPSRVNKSRLARECAKLDPVVSPVTIADGSPNWYGLGPVSVAPEHQWQGIGEALVREGLSRLRDMSARGCCLVGHPEYYGRFGFRNVPGLVYEGVPPEFFFALSFDGRYPQGTVVFHEGFKATGGR